jgi:hypothetical protein
VSPRLTILAGHERRAGRGGGSNAWPNGRRLLGGGGRIVSAVDPFPAIQNSVGEKHHPEPLAAWRTKIRSARAKAYRAIKADQPDAVERVSDYAILASSGERLQWLFPLLVQASGPTFWRILRDEWCSCDGFGGYSDALVALMSAHRRCAPRDLPDGLEQATVYRGCSRERILGAVLDSGAEGCPRVRPRPRRHPGA